MSDRPMQPYLLSILSGLLLTAAFPNAGWSILAWIALIPLLIATDSRRPKEAFAIGYAGGAAFYWSLLYWLNNVTVAGFLALTLYLAVYFPVFAILMNLAWRREGRRRFTPPAWLVAPFIWTGLEYIRTYVLSGFPWGLIGVTQYRCIPLIQISSLTGVYGVSFLLALVNVSLYECVRRRGRGCIAPAAAAAMALCASAAFGVYSLGRDIGAGEKVRVAIVQGNVPQDEKCGEGFREEIIQRFHDMTRTLKFACPELIVWPETSLPGYYWYEKRVRAAVAENQQEMRIPLLFGSEHMEQRERREYYNCAFLVDERGEIVDRYDKIHLVLFGEVIPCKAWLPFLKRVVPYEDGFTPGNRFTVFPLAPAPFGALICFEDIMPDLARGFVKRGARFLVNLTNDAWFGRTSQPYQQVAHAVFRCVENAVPMARATNTGVSCYIDYHGRIMRVLTDGEGRDIFVQGTAVDDLDLSRTGTFYTRWGNLFAIACLVVACAVIVIP
ncbi:MAG: apolipoprotein N-acyltransferase [Candidatus Aureabacteria bacterium]|nr:apolipoprotein N-acyltransferase [Candidatus Auribacterota bacterium]